MTLMGLSNVLPHLRSALERPDLEIIVKSHRSRAEIREDLIRSLSSLTPEDQSRLRRLDVVPHPPGARVSISHTPTLGGFAFINVPHPNEPNLSPALGFDLEDIARVKAKTVARVSKPDELSAAPSPAHLWCAKEAAFKALRGRVKLLSQLTITNWRSVDTASDFRLWSSEVRECGGR